MTVRSVSLLAHSGTKVGKSTLLHTAPAPRLLLDAEAAHRFLPGQDKMIFWDPITEPFPTLGQGRNDPRLGQPVYSIPWETCVVIVREYKIMPMVYNYLNQYPHPFRSASVDSISEIQERLKDQLRDLNLGQDMTERKWGSLLDQMKDLIRKFRDLTAHPYLPLEFVGLSAMTHQENGKWRPYVQGQLKVAMPYYLDVIGYMDVQTITTADPMQPTYDVRRMLISSGHPYIEAGNRIQVPFGAYQPGYGFVLYNPTIPEMINQIFGPRQEQAA